MIWIKYINIVCLYPLLYGLEPWKCPFFKVDHLELRKREPVARSLSASLYAPPSSWNVEIRFNSYSSCFYLLEVFPSRFSLQVLFRRRHVLPQRVLLWQLDFYICWLVSVAWDGWHHSVVLIYAKGTFFLWRKICAKEISIYLWPWALLSRRPSNGWASLMPWLQTVKPTSCADEVGDCISTL